MCTKYKSKLEQSTINLESHMNGGQLKILTNEKFILH